MSQSGEATWENLFQNLNVSNTIALIMMKGGRADYLIQSTQQAIQAFPDNRQWRPQTQGNILGAWSFAGAVASDETLEKKLAAFLTEDPDPGY